MKKTERDSSAKDEVECPYCSTPCRKVPATGKHVNGLKPVKGAGCEFCNPSR
jgi:hypothetical protein